MTVIAPDVSEFQTFLTDAFGRRFLIFRVTFGAHYLDPKFLHSAANAKVMYAKGQIDGVVLYHVPLSTATVNEQYAAIVKAIGPRPPVWLKGIMLDWEHWGGTSYSISGDHSSMCNQLGGKLVTYMGGSYRSVWVYGNQGDLAGIVPHRDPRFPVIVASYSSSLVYKKVKGAIGQQYTDGQDKWSVPSIAGKALPRSSAPFGRCDHNVFPGFTTPAALVKWMAPTIAKPVTPAKPVVSKPKPKPTPKPYYPAPAGNAKAMVSGGRGWAFIPTDDGHIDVRHNGVHQRYI